MEHAVYILFLFFLGACIGSFLNVVVWRLPREESLTSPGSHCPRCNKPLKWYDNIPIWGWIKLRGKCRFCHEPISKRYPVVEAVTALLFVFYYVMYYMAGVGPCPPIPQLFFAGADGLHIYHPPEAPLFLLHLYMISGLLAASLIDAELFMIPPKISWWMAGVGIAAHTLFSHPNDSGSLNLVSTIDGSVAPTAAMALGGGIGLGISLLLSRLGVLRQSFPQGEPLLEVERLDAEEENKELVRKGKPANTIPPPYSRREIYAEMRKEMAFLLPPMGLAVLFWLLTSRVPAIHTAWSSMARHDWVTGLLGSLFGALIGGMVVWVTRIIFTMAFGRLAMGLGDADLMFGVGAIIGAGAATVAFFIAPFFGILLAIYRLLAGNRREIPYGPYLGMASAAVLLCYCPIEQWLEPGLAGLGLFTRQLISGS